MRLTVRFSNTGVLAIIGLAIAILLATDIFMRPRMAAPAPVATDKIVTKEFCLTDDSGRTRARIAMNEYGSPCLQMYDSQGQTRAQLRLNRNDVPSLRLYDASGRARSITGFTLDDMQPSVVLFDEGGNGRLVANSESPSLNNKTIFDEDRTWKNGFPSSSPFGPYVSTRIEPIRIDRSANELLAAQKAQMEAEQARMEAEMEAQKAQMEAERDRARALEAEIRAQGQFHRTRSGVFK